MNAIISVPNVIRCRFLAQISIRNFLKQVFVDHEFNI